jgi:hypothetical protein
VFGAGTIEVVRYRDAARLRQAIGAAAWRVPAEENRWRVTCSVNFLALLGQAVKLIFNSYSLYPPRKPLILLDRARGFAKM